MSVSAPKGPPIDPGVVKTIVGEIAAMHYAGDVKAIAAVIIDRDGDVRILNAFGEGQRLPLLAGTAMMQHNMIADMNPIQKPRDV